LRNGKAADGGPSISNKPEIGNNAHTNSSPDKLLNQLKPHCSTEAHNFTHTTTVTKTATTSHPPDSCEHPITSTAVNQTNTVSVNVMGTNSSMYSPLTTSPPQTVNQSPTSNVDMMGGKETLGRREEKKMNIVTSQVIKKF
jgi:hypothetical protein